jgi:hypothetical protein
MNQVFRKGCPGKVSALTTESDLLIFYLTPALPRPSWNGSYKEAL